MRSFVDFRGLLVIPPSEWHVLRDLYAQDLEANLFTVYTLQNFIAWKTKNPDMDDIQICSIDDKWREHGTYIIEDRNELKYNIHFNTLSMAKRRLLLTALRRLERRPAYTLSAFGERLQPVVAQHLRSLGATDITAGSCPTLLYHLPNHRAARLQLNPLPAGLEVRPLTEENVGRIDQLWPHRYPGSYAFILRMVRNNPSMAVFDVASQELCAWVFQVENGAIGMLQVEEQHKRRGLGTHIVVRLARQLASRGLDVMATVMVTNTPSRALFEKLGFGVIDRVYWYEKLEAGQEGQQSAIIRNE